jgi:hypothetical protein
MADERMKPNRYPVVTAPVSIAGSAPRVAKQARVQTGE